jgi:hypothetical protein
VSLNQQNQRTKQRQKTKSKEQKLEEEKAEGLAVAVKSKNSNTGRRTSPEHHHELLTSPLESPRRCTARPEPLLPLSHDSILTVNLTLFLLPVGGVYNEMGGVQMGSLCTVHKHSLCRITDPVKGRRFKIFLLKGTINLDTNHRIFLKEIFSNYTLIFSNIFVYTLILTNLLLKFFT